MAARKKAAHEKSARKKIAHKGLSRDRTRVEQPLNDIFALTPGTHNNNNHPHQNK